MSGSLFNIDPKHKEVRSQIKKGVKGYAQGDIDGEILSYVRGWGYYGPSNPSNASAAGMMEELILDVARGEGIASPKTFSMNRIKGMIDDRQDFPAYRKKKHKEAALLSKFYEKGAGKKLTY